MAANLDEFGLMMREDAAAAARVAGVGALASRAPTPITADASTPVLQLEHVSKAFGGTQALADVSLTVNAGEIHGLLGENGSGKSTLIKVLSGYHEPDEGATCRIRGEEIALPIVPSAAKRLGLSFVHQDLGLVPSLSILENLRLRDISTSHARWINWHREELRARDVFARFGVALDPRKRVSDLDPTERALLAIVRAVEAMHDQRGLLVLDEPTVFLSARGIQRLFGLLRDVVARHASVLFVSHNLEEVRRLTHRVTVLRDGRVQGTVSTQDVGETELIQLILGGGVKGGWMAKQASADRRGRLLLSVKGLRGPVVKDVTVDVHAGEVIGLTGVLGSGFVDVLYHLFGARQCSEGTLVRGKITVRLAELSPIRAVQLGIALVPGDRARDGSVASLSVGDNVMLQVLGRFQQAGILKRGALTRSAATVLREFDVRPPEARKTYRQLSGGNQQKALIARWVQANPAIFLMHEPTQGVDIGARNDIFKLIRRVAAQGASFLCASSDYEQLAAICDRVLIFSRGRVSCELGGIHVEKAEIMAKVYESVTADGEAGEAWG